MRTEAKLSLPAGNILAALIFALVFICPAPGSCAENTVLARVEVPGSLDALNIPVYAAFEDGSGAYYALTFLPEDRLLSAGMSYRVLDRCPPGTRYLLAKPKKTDSMLKAARQVGIIYDDGRRLITRFDKKTDAALLRLGFDLKLMSKDPVVPTPRIECRRRAAALTAVPEISAMIGEVTEAAYGSWIAKLSGGEAVTVEDESYTILTRNTESGEPIQQATRYVYEQLSAMGGMQVSFATWSAQGEEDEDGEIGTYSGRNVVAELTGTENPEEIVIMIAHLDSVNDDSESALAPAPGADDDASGCSALLTAAGVLSKRTFKRTIRFVFSTGEEQGVLGGAAYAESVRQQDIKAVINLDMIGFNTSGTAPTQRIKIRKPQSSGYAADLEIANLFKDVVDTYGLGDSLQVIISPDGEEDSDQGSFWDRGFAAAWVIEDDSSDYNEKNYHSANDRLGTLDIAYGTAQVKATLGTIAHLADQDTASPPQSCVAEEMLGSGSPQLEVFRAFRDGTLAKTAFGRGIIRIYYANAEALKSALDSSPALKSAARRMLESAASMLGEKK